MGNTHTQRRLSTIRFHRRKTAFEGGTEGPIDENVIVVKRTECIQKYFDIAPEKLGQGRFGVTKIATDKQTNKKYACKTVSKTKLHNESEVAMLQKGFLDCKNLTSSVWL